MNFGVALGCFCMIMSVVFVMLSMYQPFLIHVSYFFNAVAAGSIFVGMLSKADNNG